MSGFVRSASLTNFAEVARGAGLDPVRLAREFGLPRACLEEPDVMVPIDAVRRLLEAAAERSGLEAFGLLMVEARRPSSLGALGLLVREQPTLRGALEAYVHYARLFNEALFLTLEESGEVFVLREELVVGGAGPVRQSTELAIGVAFQMLRAYLGPDWRPRRVCFAHPAPADLAVHQRLFGRSVEFGQGFNGVVCARRDLEVPNPAADPDMARYAKKLLDASRGPGSTTLAAQVRQFVVMQLGSGRCTIERVSQLLDVDRRTVHRHLACEGETFSGIVNAVRRELAVRYLRDGNRTLTEISALLGFSAQSGFSRWYRKHFHGTASSHRRPPRAR